MRFSWKKVLLPLVTLATFSSAIVRADVATAAPVAPTLTAVTPVDQGSSPILRWSSVATAAKYELQVCKDFACSQPIVNQGTVNTAYVTVDLPLGQTYWQVRSVNAANEPSSWSRGQFNRVKASAPVVVGPAAGAVLPYPSEAPVFSWEPVPGAEQYQVEIGPDALLATKNTYNTQTTSLSLVDMSVAVNTPYYWRVSAVLGQGIQSQSSAIRQFSLSWLSLPNPTSPVDQATKEELELEWAPVPGARGYNVAIAGNENFTNNLQVVGTNLVTNRITIPFTLIDGPYYWRVQAILPNGTFGEWSDSTAATKRTVRKEWPWPDTAVSQNRRIELLKPANLTTVNSPTLAWTPVRKASYYVVEMELDDSTEAFDNQVRISFTTNHTWFTVDRHFANLFPGTWRWRVKPMDDNIEGEWSNTTSGLNSNLAGIIGGQSPAWKFTYDYGAVTNVRNTGTISGPMIAWDAVPGYNAYLVNVYSGSNVVSSFVTNALSAEPQVTLPGTYSYTIQTVDDTGLRSISAASGSFNFARNPTNPTISITTPAVGLNGYAPSIVWSDVNDPAVDPASIRYTVRITNAALVSTVNSTFTTSYTPRGRDRDFAIGSSTGTFSVAVTATGSLKVGGAAWSSATATSSFTILPIGNTTLTEPCVDATTCDFDDTPTFSWLPVPGAGVYRLKIATSDNFNNTFYERIITGTTWTPDSSLPDSTAGESYYWYAQPCSTQSACGSEGQNVKTNVRSFRKRSAPIGGLLPASGTDVTGPVKLSWEDYLDTNQKRGGPPATTYKTDVSVKTHSQEVSRYHIQMASTPDFSNDVLDVETQATSFTPWQRTFNDGAIYWRVQGIDNSGNLLSWSAESNAANVQKIVQTTPRPNLVTPAVDEVVSTTPVFKWDAMTHAQAYQFELYQDPDPLQGISDVNLRARITTNSPLYALTIPLAIGAYGWRVRRIDVQNRFGPWSANSVAELRKFTYTGNKPILTSPANNAVKAGDDILFTWTPVNRASRYKFEASKTADFASIFDSGFTTASAYAPWNPVGTDSVYWRVSAYFGDTLLGTSDSFTLIRAAVGCENGVANGSGFFAVAPYRVYDSRSRAEGRLGAGASRNLVIAGVTGSNIPSNAFAVVMNVTAVDPTAESYMTIYPTGTVQPDASSLNYVPGQTVPNQVTAMVGSGGTATFFNAAGTVHVLVDVVGYYGPTGAGAPSKFNSMAPQRFYDSRSATKFGPGTIRDVQVAGLKGVPAGATAIATNITAVDATAESYMTVWPTGNAQPNASNLNYVANLVVPNAVTVKVGAGGKISIFNATGNVHVLVDVVGWYETANGMLFHPISPARIMDSRKSSIMKTNESRESPGRGVGCVPALGADSIVVNATVAGATGDGYLTLWNEGLAPNASNINWGLRKTVPNAATVKLGADGKYRVFTSSDTHVIVDVVGWFGSV